MMRHLVPLSQDNRGAIAIETAMVAPVLLLLSLGAFQASEVVARHNELQSAVGEASTAVLAVAPTTSGELTTLKNVVAASTNLTSNKVTLTFKYRCGEATAYVNSPSGCSDFFSTYVEIVLSDTYNPVWTAYGIAEPINLSVTRYVITRQSEE